MKVKGGLVARLAMVNDLHVRYRFVLCPKAPLLLEGCLAEGVALGDAGDRGPFDSGKFGSA